jgi:hypothetical protein
MEDRCVHRLKALARESEVQLESAPRTVNLNKFERSLTFRFKVFSLAKVILPAVTLRANGTATLAAPAINKIEVRASHWRDGRSHSN